MWTHIIFINLNLPTKSSPLTPPPPYHYSLQGVTRVVVKAMMIVFHERYKFYVHSYRIAMIFIFQSIIKMIREHGYVHIGMLHIKMECALVHIIFQKIYPSILFIITSSLSTSPKWNHQIKDQYTFSHAQHIYYVHIIECHQ